MANLQFRVMKGRVGSKNCQSKQTGPFEKLSITELLAELKSRNIILHNTKATKKDLLPLFKKELRGTK